MTLNLREKIKNGFDIQFCVEKHIDTFLTPLFLNQIKSSQKCKTQEKKINFYRIIVGKGLGSKHFIKGKNPIKFYAESYLTRMNIDFVYAGDFEGGNGVLVFSL